MSNRRISQNQFEVLRVFDTTPEEKEEVDLKLEAGLMKPEKREKIAQEATAASATLSKSGGHSWEFWLSSIQKYSTFPPTVFLGLHFTTTALIPLITRSIPESETFLLQAREVYQAPVLEHGILTVPVIAHIVSGVTLRYLRCRRRTKTQRDQMQEGESNDSTSPPATPGFPMPSIQARMGYALVPLLGTHVFFNRVLPLWVDGGSSSAGLSYAAHGIARAPWLMGLGYVAFIGVGVSHFAGGAAAYGLGWRNALDWPFTGKDGPVYSSRQALRVRRWKILNGISLVTSIAWLAGGVGIALLGKEVIGSSWEVKEWNRIYEAVPFVGKYLTT